MTPDEVVNVLKEIKEYGLDPDCFSNADKQQALSTAISLLQDYQKLREKLNIDKIVANVPFYQNIMPVERQEIVKQIVTYLQQPTEPTER